VLWGDKSEQLSELLYDKEVVTVVYYSRETRSLFRVVRAKIWGVTRKC